MSRLGRSAVLAAAYCACGVLFVAALVRVGASAVALVRGDRAPNDALLSAAVGALSCTVLVIAFRALGALRVRWGVDFGRPRVHRSTFDV